MQSLEKAVFISSSADIWSHHRKSYMGTAYHWPINSETFERETVTISCRRFL